MIDHLLGTPCTVVNRVPNGTNGSGEQIWTETPMATTCHINPTGTDENIDPDARATVAATIYLRPDVPVGEHDRITAAGVSWEVTGIPVQRRRAPTGQVHHLEVPVRVTR